MPATYRSATRLQTSILAAAEKRLLIWLACRLPRGVTSDQLTLVALVAMLAAGLSYWLASVHPAGLVLATVCLAVNWFGDSLDGTLARVRHLERPRYGYYVDHVIDAAGTLFLLGGLALSGYMSATVALALLAAYFLLMIEVYLATNVLSTFRMGFFGFGPTELRIILAIGNARLLVSPTADLFGTRYLLFDVGGAIAAVGLLGTFLFSAVRNTRTLYLAEPIPAAQQNAGGR